MSQAIDKATPRLSGPLRLMQPGSHDQPLVLIPGADGSAFALHRLARQIGGGRAVYAFQSIGLDGRTAPLETIEAIAAAYLVELRRVQPIGPYALAGRGMGGLIAFELAQLLAVAGERVAPLVLIDTALPCGKLGKSWRPALQVHLDALRQVIRSAAPARVLSRARRAWNGLTDVSRLQIHLTRAVDIRFFGGPPPDEAAIITRVRNANIGAERAYRPRTYHGDIILLQSERSAPVSIDPRLWRRLARSLDVVKIPADDMAEAIAGLLVGNRADHRPESPRSTTNLSVYTPWTGLMARRGGERQVYCAL
jgi:acetoacetyl-CoA synthetase